MTKRKPATSKAAKPARGASAHRVSNGKRAKRPVSAAQHEREHKPRAEKTPHEVAIFGPGPKGATHFCMARLHEDGSRERLSLNKNGVADEHFPLRLLNVADLRRIWGPGRYRGQWMTIADSRWTGLGTIREVKILPVDGVQRAGPSRRVATSMGYEVAGSLVDGRSAPAPTEPAEVVDIRVRAEREIAQQRLAFEREMFERRHAAEREDHERRFSELQEQIERVESMRSRDDGGDDEPGPWDWLAPLIEKLRPTIESLLPQVLSNLAKTKGLPA